MNTRFTYSVLFLLICTIISCTNDDANSLEESTPKEDYLTINGDTRILRNPNEDADLKIEKFIEFIPKNNLFSLNDNVMVIGVDIYDPNRALITNFGNYNINGDYVLVRFVVPVDFEAGEYTTINQRVVPSDYQTFGGFTIQDELSFTSDEGYSIQITEQLNKYILEFKNINFEGGKATLSGKVTVNKT